MRELKKRTFEIISESRHGGRLICVVLQQWKVVKLRRMVPVGPRVEGIGGFKYAKDFDHSTAFQCAMENAVAQMQTERGEL